MSETPQCVYNAELECKPLARLKLEFKGHEHHSLIYGQLLPKYCPNCPQLNQTSQETE